MIARERLRPLFGCAIAVLLMFAAGALFHGAGSAMRSKPTDELLYYPSGIMLRQASLGYEAAAADVAWLRGIQYYGEHRLTDQKYDQIGHVMHIVTELDPRFEQPYVFGAFVLAQELREPQRGLDLLMRGFEANPESWRLAFEIGFLHYVCRHDYASASRYFTWASRLPGHPDYAERFAAFANERAGNAGMAALLWRQVLATGNRYMQEIARRELDRIGAP